LSVHGHEGEPSTVHSVKTDGLQMA
jgi:hypothetical protein